jgi:hypothetical protein
MWAADLLGESARRKAVRFSCDEQPENLKPRGLPQCRKRGEGMRNGNPIAPWFGADMADDGQSRFLHKI